MNEIIDRILDFAVSKSLLEGKRYVQVKALELWIDTIRGIRKVTLGYFASLIAVIFLCSTGITLCLHGLYQFQTYGFLYLDPAIGTCLAIFGICIVFVIWNLRESRWFDAFGINKYLAQSGLNSNCSTGYKKRTSHTELSIEKEEIRQIISDLLDEKLRHNSEQASPNKESQN
ncbi:MAG: hypothetical protein KDD35_05755 [Bdellovibrionales bacterium]|nr:hypothetical protein [Bdellovibrionales bacterium]